MHAEQVERIRQWIENYHRVKDHLEKISDINRELLRREKKQTKTGKKKAQKRRRMSTIFQPYG